MLVNFTFIVFGGFLNFMLNTLLNNPRKPILSSSGNIMFKYVFKSINLLKLLWHFRVEANTLYTFTYNLRTGPGPGGYL